MNETDYRVDLDTYPYAYGRPALTGRLRASPQDFRVEEILGFEPDGPDANGNSPHLLLWVEKTGANTEWVARQFAKVAKCRPMDVGYCGMKDRHAVTLQWFSVPEPKSPVEWTALDVEGVRVLEVHAHRRKLRRGSHAANRFVLTLRDVQGEDDIGTRLSRVATEGVPNYFGQQRFGPRGDNVVRALDGARGGIYLSASRSFLFNSVLTQRIERGDWNQLLPGEAVQLEGSGSFFIIEDVDMELQRRLDEFDVHPSGPLWGKGELSTRNVAAELETTIAERMPEITQLLESVGMRQERRSLRLGVRNASVEKTANDTLVVAFELPSGAFATSVLRELINTVEGQHQRGERHAAAD